MQRKNLLLTVITGIVCLLSFYKSNAIPVVKKLITVHSDSTKRLAATWNFKREIVIENSGSRAADAVIQIQLNNAIFDYTKTRADGSDIRFSATSASPKDAGLSYWIEKWNDSGASTLWVKLPVLKAHGQSVIYMHYGNADARPVSNGNNTFLFFDDFENGDYTKKWNNISIGEVAEQGGILKLKETDGQDGIISAAFDITGQMIIRTCYQRGGADEHWTRAGVGGWNKWLCFGDHTEVAGTGTNYVMFYDSASLGSLATAPLVKAANKIITDRWRTVSYWYDGHFIKGMQDDVMVQWPVKTSTSKLSLRTLDNDEWDNFAFITVSHYLNPAPVITIGAQKN